MIPLGSPELARLVQSLEKYDLKSTLPTLAGLLTVPRLQAHTLRIETLVHLSVAHCHGKRKPGHKEVGNWLNRQLGGFASSEDPVEDVFITNVETADGNRRIFEGIWELNDYFLQATVDCLQFKDAPKECGELLDHAHALLKVSDLVAERCNLQRWDSEPSRPGGEVKLRPVSLLAECASAVTLTLSDLEEAGITRELLEPFIIDSDGKSMLTSEQVGHTSLERRPLVDVGGDLVLALPHAVSPAIRRFVLGELKVVGYLPPFEICLARLQARQVERDALWELRDDLESIDPPKAKDNLPSLAAWLFRYDISKFLLVVLLNDHLESLEEEGLSSALRYPDNLRTGLTKYVHDAADYCRGLPDFSEGIVCFVFGGLGRGYVLGFDEWPDRWNFTSIRIPDFLMLADELGGSVERFLKLAKQREWAEKEGVRFVHLITDYGLYCHWRNVNYQLVPRNLPVRDNSMLTILSDVLLPVRQGVRKLVDRHLIMTVGGQYSGAIRFGREAYFRSMQDRPIYAGVDYILQGTLAGVVETARGPSWLIVQTSEGDERLRYLFYQMWSGFLGLYEYLVLEVERSCARTAPGALEIRLDLTEVIVPEDREDLASDPAPNPPTITVDLESATTQIRFLPDLFSYFQKPENTGEKLVLRSMAEALVCLHEGVTSVTDKDTLDNLVESVLPHPGMRVLHLFHSFYPIDFLLIRDAEKPTFLPHEDFVFSKLKLSEGCADAASDTTITSKEACNSFLHNAVEKIWQRLRSLLKQYDRASVIRRALSIQEDAIQDREQWGRTAQAVLTLYGPPEEVTSVAQARESDRTNVSLAARCIIEMGICECPYTGGRPCSKLDMDTLLANASLLIEVAMDSDAINGDLVKPRIHIELNGEYSLKRDFHETIIRPFLAAYFREGFEGAAADYSRLYERQQPKERRPAAEVFSTTFVRAFRTEFGLSPDEALDGFGELMDLAVERDSAVVESTFGDLVSRLTKERGLSSEAAGAFLRTFGIFHRREWDKPPEGFKMKDIYPWRFRRRLSATARPILLFGTANHDKALYGAGALKLAFGYLFDRSEQGQLPQEFFNSEEMKRYIGDVNRERGHQFALDVAAQFRERGWQARSEVEMTKLGAAAELGDIDVLAWKAAGDVLIVECKRLQLARTIAEIAEICRRFRGEEEDELHKHVRRVTYIRNNPECLKSVINFTPDPACIDERLVTNTHVPMMYLKSLPIDSGKIGPLR